MWGYQVLAASGGEEPDDVSILPIFDLKEEVAPVLEEAQAEAGNEYRSPFLPPAALFEQPAPEDETSAVEAVPAEPEPPPLTLIGVVDETALLQDPAGGVHLVSRGEMLEEVRIEKIDPDRVLIRFEGVIFELFFSVGLFI